MWIARDKSGTICIYDTKPVKDELEWVIPNSTGGYSVLDSEMEGLEDGDVLIFKLEEQEDGTDLFMPVEDETLLNEVFDEYLKAVADHECDCGCEDCDGECDCEGEHHDCDCGKCGE